MANNISVEIKGTGNLLSKIKALVPKVRDGVKEAVAITALQVETDAKLFAPVDTGRLRSSIVAEIAPNGLSAVVEVRVNYGLFVEFGTRSQRAQPFLGPAYEKNRLAFIENLKANTKFF